jgi:hypothetical protein
MKKAIQNTTAVGVFAADFGGFTGALPGLF